MRVSAYAARYPARDHVEAFFRAAMDAIAELPAVRATAAGSSLPLSGQMSGTSVVAEGAEVAPGSRQTAGWQFVTPGYFEALGMPLRRGRDFTAADRRHDGHVTVINEALARAIFPGQDPIGRRIAIGGGDSEGDWHEVVGVVGDVRHGALTETPAPRVYDLFGEHWGRTLYVVLRSGGIEAASLAPGVRRAIARLDADAPVFEAATMDALASRSMAPQRLSAALAAGLALAAVLIALLGIYATVAASVADRTREIGIRAALGAAPRDLLRLVLREGAATSAAGALAGFAGSLLAVPLLGSQLFDVRAGDVALLVPVVSLVLLAIAMLAALPGARRAAGADPLIAIRAE
jgi:predicted permease